MSINQKSNFKLRKKTKKTLLYKETNHTLVLNNVSKTN